MKPMVFFIRKKLKNSKWPSKKILGKLSIAKVSSLFSQKAHFPVPPIFIFFEIFFQGLVLGLVGLISAKGIDVAQPIWL